MKYSGAVFVIFLSLFGYLAYEYQDADITLLFYERFGREPCSVLQGKTVWITGASSGIGEHLAYELAKCQCKLVLSARRKEKLLEVRDKCGDIAAERSLTFDKEKDILVLPLDVKDWSSHSDLTSQVIKYFGKVDILVNNAGVTQTHKIEDNPFEIEKTVLDINFLGTISLTKNILPHMLKRREGQIVAVTSAIAKFGHPNLAASSASKHALQGYLNSLRLEAANRNIKVMTVLPGPVSTEIFENALTDVVNVTYRNSRDKKSGAEASFSRFMSAHRCAYIMCVGMANELREVWPSTYPLLSNYYMAQYMPSFFYWFSENVLFASKE